MLDNMENTCNQLLDEICKIWKTHEQEWRNSGNYFDIFSALGIERKEIRHSALLATLLNPNAFHGISDCFLKAFLKYIDFDKLQSENAIVKKEEYVGKNARFDISIESADKKFKVVIENKIDSKDHDNQLNKYFSELKNGEYEDYRIVYLTLYGEKPIEEIPQEDEKKLICISYENNILAIIDTVFSLKKTMPNPVSEIMKQYVLTVKNITNQGVDKKMSEEIQKLLASREDYLKSALIMRDEIDAAFFRHYLPEKIFENIKVDSFSFISNVSKISEEGGNFGEFSNGNINLQIGFAYNNYDGFSIWGYLKDYTEEQLEKIRIATQTIGNTEKNIFGDKQKDRSTWAIFFDDYCNMKNKMKDVLDNPDNFKNTVQNLLQKIVNVIQ